MAIYKRVSGTVSLLSSSAIDCYSGMAVRTVVRGSSIMVIHTSPYAGTIGAWPGAVSITDTAIASGAAGVGAYNTPSGNAISQVQLGGIDSVAPSAVNAQSIATYVLPNRVEMQWQGVLDDANGIGLWDYHVFRNGTYIGQTFTPEFDDDAVSAGTAYTYSVQAFDVHQNASATTAFAVTTPAAGSIDARRVGVRPLGSYWGAAGEQIDTLSGNMNYTIPILTAMGRSGWSANFNLNYNSQLWRKDSGGTWNLGRDVGYGFGWRLLAGAITPIWTSSWTIHHFIYTDATGAEYRLDQFDSPNCMWTSREGVYVGYNSCVNRLYFADGSYWLMGATSGGTEQDAGVLYPTTMEDTNGNQVIIQYQNGLGSPLANSSARITSIEDSRGVAGQGYKTFAFTYNTDAIPHLTNTTSYIAGVGNWVLTYNSNTPLNSPFTPSVSYGTTTTLASVGRDADGLPGNTFMYDASGSGELTQATTMRGGTFNWAYRNFTYAGSRTFREVQNRYLTIQTGGTQYTYPFSHNDAVDAGLSIHSATTLDDASGIGEKVWTFATSGQPWQLGLLASLNENPSAAQASQPLRTKQHTWVQDSAGMPYLGTVLTTLDPTGANSQSKITQTVDTHGNVTQTNFFDYGNLTTAARTYNYVYNYSWSGFGFTTYRLTSATATNGTQTFTTVTNTYDATALTNVTGMHEHDAAYTTSATIRGNISVTTPLGGPSRTITRDIGGNILTVNDGLGHTISNTVNSSTNFVAPSVITANSDSNSNQTLGYTASLAPNSYAGPNATTASAIYDAWNRPSSTTSVMGATTSYSYGNVSSVSYAQALLSG